jgi:lysophospholipase L1-like esterase
MTFYASTGQGVFKTKLTGVAATTTTGLSWFQLGTDPAWSPHKAEWKIRIYDATHFSILLNGMEIIEAQETAGPIIDAGFGLYGLSALTASMSYWTKTRRTEPLGRSPARLFIVGDSTSASRLGSWEYYCKEVLDGTHGMRVWDVFNQAHSGDSTATQLALMSTNVADLVAANHLVIFCGINDSQGSGPATALTNIEDMILYANSHGFGDNGRITLVVPHVWYTQALSGGSGVNTGSNDAHAAYRAGLKKLAARRGCRMVDLTEVLAAITADDLGRVDTVFPYLRDNIHPTNYAYKVIGEAIAREIMAGSSIKMTQAEPYTLIDSSRFLAGWTAHGSGQSPAYSVSEAGIVTLYGLLDKGTTTSPTTIMNLPANLRPVALREYYARTSTGSVTVIYVTTAGDVIISGFPATVTTYVSLDNISFQLAA